MLEFLTPEFRASFWGAVNPKTVQNILIKVCRLCVGAWDSRNAAGDMAKLSFDVCTGSRRGRKGSKEADCMLAAQKRKMLIRKQEDLLKGVAILR